MCHTNHSRAVAAMASAPPPPTCEFIVQWANTTAFNIKVYYEFDHKQLDSYGPTPPLTVRVMLMSQRYTTPSEFRRAPSSPAMTVTHAAIGVAHLATIRAKMLQNKLGKWNISRHDLFAIPAKPPTAVAVRTNAAGQPEYFGLNHMTREYGWVYGTPPLQGPPNIHPVPFLTSERELVSKLFSTTFGRPWTGAGYEGLYPPRVWSDDLTVDFKPPGRPAWEEVERFASEEDAKWTQWVKDRDEKVDYMCHKINSLVDRTIRIATAEIVEDNQDWLQGRRIGRVHAHSLSKHIVDPDAKAAFNALLRKAHMKSTEVRQLFARYGFDGFSKGGTMCFKPTKPKS